MKLLMIFLYFVGTAAVVSQGLPVPLVGLVIVDLLITHNKIVFSTYAQWKSPYKHRDKNMLLVDLNILY